MCLITIYRVKREEPMQQEMATNYETLIAEDRLHASLYTDPRIFAEEMEKIFSRGWVFVGHDSEIPQPGDFVTRFLGQQPVIMVRGKDGQVSVLLNRCAHRGTTVCPAERGNTRVFVCPYHGWTYDLNGTLTGVPYPGAYGQAFVKKTMPCRVHRAWTAIAALCLPLSV